MSRQDAALCVIAGLAVLCGTGLATARVMYRRKALPGDVILVLAPSFVLGMWALAGVAWWLSGGTVN